LEGIEKENYEGYEASTDLVPLFNDPTGKPIFLRRFHFQAPIGLKDWPSKRFLSEQHQPAIEKFLWRDEMKLVDKLRVVLNERKGTFDIFAVCQPKTGADLFEKPKTLQEIFKPEPPNETRRD